MKAKIVVALLLCLLAGFAGAQSGSAAVPQELADGLRAFQAGDFAEALASFEAARARNDIPAWNGHAVFWSARTQMARARYDEAADVFDIFLASFDDHPYLEESSYQRARIFYLKEEYGAAIDRFTEFMTDYPRSEFYPNALYWTGESLFSLGRLDEAERLFAEVTDSYPTSYRVEAARYRLDVIELSRRENELLTLLQWSHEEYLAALEGFQLRERSYQEALRSYRNRLASLATEDFQAEIAALGARVQELEAGIADRDARINELLAQLRQVQGGTGPAVSASDPDRTQAPPADTATASDLELRETLLSLKAQALELQQLLLDEEEGGQ